VENTDISIINGTIDAGGKLTALIKNKNMPASIILNIMQG